MKIIKQGDTSRIVYVAKNFQTGLTDVSGKAISPAGTVTSIPWSGTTPSAGFCELGQGLYYYDWSSSGAALGTWAFKVDSVSKPNAGADSAIVIDATSLANTPLSVLDTLLTNVLSALQNATYGLSAIATNASSAATDAAAIKTLAQGTDGFTAIKTIVAAIQNAVGAISNSTKNTWTTQGEVKIPSSGSITRRIFLNIFDDAGNMNDPDSNSVTVKCYDASGTDISTRILGAANPAMTKDAVGQYRIDYTVASTETEQPIRFVHSYVEQSKAVVRDGIVSLVVADTGISGTLTSISNKEDANAALLAAIEGAGFSGSTDSLHQLRIALDGYLNAGGTITSLITTINTALTNDIKGTGFSAASDSLHQISLALQNVTAIGGRVL